MGALKKEELPQQGPGELVICTPAQLRALVVRAVREAQFKPVPEFMTSQQVAYLLRTSTRNILNFVARKELRATRVDDREWRFRRDDVFEFMEQRASEE